MATERLGVKISSPRYSQPAVQQYVGRAGYVKPEFEPL